MSPSIRAFLAIPLGDDARAQVRQLCRQLAAELPTVRWNSAETLHLTLKFFPAIEEESLEKIGEVMLSVGRFSAPFQVRMKGLGTFPNQLRPRVFWLGFEQDRPLRNLHRRLDQELERIGIPIDSRPFAPHLTLGRSRGGLGDVRAILDPLQPGLDLELPVAQLILYQSRLLPSGAQHLPRKIVQLQGLTTPS